MSSGMISATTTTASATFNHHHHKQLRIDPHDVYQDHKTNFRNLIDVSSSSSSLPVTDSVQTTRTTNTPTITADTGFGTTKNDPGNDDHSSNTPQSASEGGGGGGGLKMMILIPGNENLSSSPPSNPDKNENEVLHRAALDDQSSLSSLNLNRPLHLFSFVFFLIVLPLLSIQNFKHPNRNRRRTTTSGNRRTIYPADYVPDQSIIDSVQEPLRTRKHFRISHYGNYDRSESDFEEEETESEDEKDCKDEEGATEDRYIIRIMDRKVLRMELNKKEKRRAKGEKVEYRLVFGKRMRGEEDEFCGRSAMKGSRAKEIRSSLSPSSSSSSSSSSGLKPPSERLRISFDSSIPF